MRNYQYVLSSYTPLSSIDMIKPNDLLDLEICVQAK